MTQAVETEGIFYEKALNRVNRLMRLLVAAGTVVLAVAFTWQAAGGFLIGAVIGSLNYRWLKRLATKMGGASGEKSNSGSAVLFGLRYFLLGGAAYVTVNYLGVDVIALLCGLFIPAAAVILEILFELIYARV
jgi:hypothetical protein